MSPTPQSPPSDGSLTVLPGLLDFHAEHNPDFPWAIYPSSAVDTVSISFLEFSRATHRVAHFLRPRGSPPGRGVVGMLIHCDTILYVTMLVGIARAGLVPFPISTRNSPEAVTNLLLKSSCSRVITHPSLDHLLSNAHEVFAAREISLRIDELPDIHNVYPALLGGDCSALTTEKGPFVATERPQDDDMALYIHSAGSTGLPKPIPLTQQIILQWIRSPLFVGIEKHGIRWAAMALPTFHSMGILTQVLTPLVTGLPVALYPPKSPAPPVVPNPQNVLDGIRICGCNAVMTVPSFVEIWAESEETVKFLGTLKLLTFGGGPLSAENGNKLISAGVRLASAYGATEAGPVAHLFDGFDSDSADPNARTMHDWQWQRMPPHTKPRWVPQGDGSYELQFLTCETHQPSVENLPDARGYATKDLWVPHPTKKGLWRIVGRKDDVIVLGSGEKIVPVPQERHIASHPWVADAVMFGRGKAQAGILIDPVSEHTVNPTDGEAVSRFIDAIWTHIEQANEEAPTFARIFREMIILSDPAKPLPRAAKGNIVRKPTLDLYADVIEHLYETMESSSNLKDVGVPNAWVPGEIESWLLSLTASVNHGHPLDLSVDIFEQGFDSLHATFIRNHIVNALRASPESDIQAAATLIDQNIVYANPTVQKLAARVASVISTKASESLAVDQARLIDQLVKKYSANLSLAPQASDVPRSNIVVFLTGSTGSLGSYILAHLLAHPNVATVYAFNRPSRTPVDRQLASFEDRGLPTEVLNGSKYIPLFGDLNDNQFGLSEEVFKEIASSVTHVVHNGWRVDFNHALGSFESQISGTRKLVDLCLSLGCPARLLFTSSIGVAHGWPAPKGLVPESPLSNPEYASDSGYSASKYVVEQVLAKAHENGLEATSLRVGQVSGSESSGAWNVTDWVPILVKSGVNLGYMPDLEEPVTWIPVDAVADAFIDLMLSPTRLPQLVNVVHPRPVTWEEVVSSMSSELSVPLRLLPLKDYLEKVTERAGNAKSEDMEKIPAIKLLGFFRSLSSENGARPVFDTSTLQTLSGTMRNLGPMRREHATMWVKYWKKKGFLQ